MPTISRSSKARSATNPVPSLLIGDLQTESLRSLVDKPSTVMNKFPDPPSKGLKAQGIRVHPDGNWNASVVFGESRRKDRCTLRGRPKRNKSRLALYPRRARKSFSPSHNGVLLPALSTYHSSVITVVTFFFFGLVLRNLQCIKAHKLIKTQFWYRSCVQAQERWITDIG